MVSRREVEVIRFLAQGLTVSEIARRLDRSVKTISQQKRDAMRKLNLESDKQLYDYARSIGLL
nr:LuxR C-terminal-related transcriptional regulator [Dyella sp. ASV24]